MTKRERVLAAVARGPVDRAPVAFWRHAPEVDHTARGLADAMLAFHRRFDLDLVKVMSSGVYCVEDWGCRVAYAGAPSGAKQCVEHAVNAPGDWTRIAPLDPGAGALGRELEALRLIVKERGDDAPVLHTVFAPLTVARKLRGDALADDLRAAPDLVAGALEAITATVARYALAALEAGADGLFLATQTASRDAVTAEELGRFELPSTRRVAEAVAPRSPLTLLHAHGRDVAFDELARLPVHAINWHDRVTPPALGEAQRRFRGAVVGGLAEWDTLRRGPASAVAAEVADALRQTGGRGVVVAPGCVLPLDVPDAHLDAVVDAVKRSQP
ncbi:MAG: uroporphyrinogen decarboxylase [Candidatus Rokubacteria bacterium]|nr:uroporphyrinogen decarboxylase [Candidatus Rokubacteria bacterium]MBI2492492.1 uroporphyrinogen decarboxylase [Candidatus Rokubacteria bacterium]